MRFYRKFAGMHGLFVPTFLLISTFAQTVTALTFVNLSFSAIFSISRIRFERVSIDESSQGSHGTEISIPVHLSRSTWEIRVNYCSAIKLPSFASVFIVLVPNLLYNPAL